MLSNSIEFRNLNFFFLTIPYTQVTWLKWERWKESNDRQGMEVSGPPTFLRRVTGGSPTTSPTLSWWSWVVLCRWPPFQGPVSSCSSSSLTTWSCLPSPVCVCLPVAPVRWVSTVTLPSNDDGVYTPYWNVIFLPFSLHVPDVCSIHALLHFLHTLTLDFSAFLFVVCPWHYAGELPILTCKTCTHTTLIYMKW
jgi:hypothetical protein